MKKFEVGKIYGVVKRGGCGYDEWETPCFVKIVRKTDKSIKYNEYDRAVKLYVDSEGNESFTTSTGHYFNALYAEEVK